LLRWSNRQITREYTTGLPSRLTRFRVPVEAHAHNIIRASLYEEGCDEVNTDDGPLTEITVT
jgi:hypothetical protein